MAKGPVQVATLVGGIPTQQTISDNIEVFGYFRRIAVFDAVCASPDRKVARASARHPETCIGIMVRFLPRRHCEVLTQGVIENFDPDGRLDPNADYFLGAEPGTLTTEPPSDAGQRVQFIGLALNSTDLLILPEMRRFVNTTSGKGPKNVVWSPTRKQFELA